MASLSNLLAGEAGSGVKPPVVIQEFVEHGGVLFKVWWYESMEVPYLGVCYRSQTGRCAGLLLEVAAP